MTLQSVPKDRPRSLLRAARQFQSRLDHRARTASCALFEPARQLLALQDVLQRRWRLLGKAERRGWSLAAVRLRDELLRDAVHVRDRAADLSQHNSMAESSQPADPPGTFIRTLLGELQQLHDEFEDVELDLRQQVIAAQTTSIELEGLALGPFRIELHIQRLSSRADVSAFRCVALKPNPAASNDDVTHPHVKAEGLCGGDATEPIELALRQGRVCDAFCLVRSVLSTYNASSPYVSLEEWDGVRCDDCDGVTSRDELYFCETCQRNLCGDCSGGGCELCDRSCCRGCLETDEISGRECCSHCRHTCDDCGRTVDADHFDPETDLCPQCLANQQEDEAESDPQSEPTQPEEIHHELEGVQPLQCDLAPASAVTAT